MLCLAGFFYIYIFFFVMPYVLDGLLKGIIFDFIRLLEQVQVVEHGLLQRKRLDELIYDVYGDLRGADSKRNPNWER